MSEIRLKMRNVVAATICLAGIALFPGCEKDDIVLHDPIIADVLYPKDSRLKQISHVQSVQSKETGMIETRYEYDEQGRVSKVTRPMYEDGTPANTNGTIIGLFSYSDYIYNSKGQLEKIIYNHSNNNGFLNLTTYTYTYDGNGNKRKEVTEYPHMAQHRVDSTLYFYVNNRLMREATYEDGYFGSAPWRSELVSYITYEYDNQGKLVKETKYSGINNEPVQFSVHSYRNGLNVKTEVFNKNDRIREIRRYYDTNNHLIYLESEELSLLSSAMSYVMKYEYY